MKYLFLSLLLIYANPIIGQNRIDKKQLTDIYIEIINKFSIDTTNFCDSLKNNQYLFNELRLEDNPHLFNELRLEDINSPNKRYQTFYFFINMYVKAFSIIEKGTNAEDSIIVKKLLSDYSKEIKKAEESFNELNQGYFNKRYLRKNKLTEDILLFHKSFFRFYKNHYNEILQRNNLIDAFNNKSITIFNNIKELNTKLDSLIIVHNKLFDDEYIKVFKDTSLFLEKSKLEINDLKCAGIFNELNGIIEIYKNNIRDLEENFIKVKEEVDSIEKKILVKQSAIQQLNFESQLELERFILEKEKENQRIMEYYDWLNKEGNSLLINWNDVDDLFKLDFNQDFPRRYLVKLPDSCLTYRDIISKYNLNDEKDTIAVFTALRYYNRYLLGYSSEKNDIHKLRNIQLNDCILVKNTILEKNYIWIPNLAALGLKPANYLIQEMYEKGFIETVEVKQKSKNNE